MKTLLLLMLLLGFTIPDCIAQEIKNDSLYNITTKSYTPPEFPGGVDAFRKHVTIRMRGYKPKVNGTAIIYFIVEPDGTVSLARAVKGIDNETDARLVNIVRKSVKWKPAIQDGKSIRASYTLPVTINL